MGDAGPADTDNEDWDYYPLDHTYIRYSHKYSATGPTPHMLNTDDTSMYRSNVQADLPSFLMPRCTTCALLAEMDRQNHLTVSPITVEKHTFTFPFEDTTD